MSPDKDRAGSSFENGNSEAPLSVTVWDRCAKVADMMLWPRRVDPNARDENGRTLLSRAAENGQTEQVKTQLKIRRIDLNVRDLDGWTPLARAAEHGHAIVVKMLLGTGKVGPSLKDTDSWNPLLRAAENGHVEVVEMLLDACKVDPRLKVTDYWNPLGRAAANGHAQVVNMLLENHKFDPSLKDKDYWNPLERAAANGHAEVVKILLENHKVDPSLKDRGYCHLREAAVNGHAEVVKMLLENHEIHSGLKYCNWSTSLQAVRHAEVVNMLLENRHEVDPVLDNWDWDSLLQAVEDGHAEVVKIILDNYKVHPSWRDRHEQGGPLIVQAQYKHEHEVSRLTMGQVDPSLKVTDGRPPMTVARDKHVELMKLLLSSSTVDPNVENEFGVIPLIRAARDGHVRVVEMLLDTGKVDLNVRDTNGETPLSQVIQHWPWWIVSLCVDIGMTSDPNLQNENDWLATYGAYEELKKEITKALLKNGNIGLIPKIGVPWKELLLVTTSWHSAIVRMMLDTGKVDLNATDHDGRTALIIAVARRNVVVVKMLLDTGKVDVNVRDDKYQTPLSVAIQNRDEQVVKMLLDTGKVDPRLKHGKGWTDLLQVAKKWPAMVVEMVDTGKVDLNMKDKDGDTLLLQAVGDRHVKAVKMLLDTGKVDVNVRDEDGWTSLLVASQNGDAEIVKMLLDTSKVDLNMEDAKGRTSLSVAAQNGHSEVCKLLLDTGKVELNVRDADGWTPLSVAAKNGHIEVCEMLLDTRTIELNVRDAEGRTPLLQATQNTHAKVVKMLLDTGKVDVNMGDGDRRTSLLVASQNGDAEIVKMLLDTGNVDVNLRDWRGWTPLFSAVEIGNAEVVKMFLNTGKVDLTVKDGCGRSAISRAAANGHIEVMKVLFGKGIVNANLSHDGSRPWKYEESSVESICNSLQYLPPLYTSLNPERFETRLLEIQEPGRDDGSPIVCTLGVVSLPTKPKYHALSYCWGGRASPMLIQIENHLLWVTSNLEAALKQLRRRGITSVWIDALCINQEDLYEKNQQLRLMSHVYSGASSVYAWLGPSTKESNLAMSVLKARNNTCDIDPSEQGAANKALQELFARPFWRRVWIIQEISKAPEVHFLCGNDKVAWDDVSYRFESEIPGSHERDNYLLQLAKFRSQEQQDHGVIQRMFLLSALLLSRYSLATDARDKIYAILGLSSDGNDVVPLPNYMQAKDDVFIDATAKMITRQRQSAVILFARRRSHISPGLPSWVPDWESTDDIPPWIWIACEQAHSVLGSHAKLTAPAIEVPGKILETICDTADGISINCARRDDEYYASSTCEIREPRSISPGRILEDLRNAIALGDPQPDYLEWPKPLGSPAALILYKLSLNRQDQPQATCIFNWIEANRNFRIGNLSIQSWLEAFKWKCSGLTELSGSDEYLKRESTLLSSSLARMDRYDVKIASSSRSMLRIVYTETQVGDKVCRLENCPLPVVLRPVEQGFRFIGEVGWHGEESQNFLSGFTSEEVEVRPGEFLRIF